MVTTLGTTEFQNGESAVGNRLRLAEGPLNLSWHHCSTTSEFLGEFFALQIAPGTTSYNETRHGIGYLANELLENAVKFRWPGDILIESSIEGSRFEIKVTNLVDPDVAERFKAMLAEVTTREPGELLIERIEANAADAASTGSGLGLLTLMSDYGARLGWKFHEEPGRKPVTLETFAALNLY